MSFTTPRLEVRRLTLADLDGFHEIWGDPEVIFWGPSADPDVSRTRLRALAQRRLRGVNDSGWFAAIRRCDGRMVGDVVLQPAPWGDADIEVGWHLAKAWQGQGYATEAAAGLLEHARRHGVSRVHAKILPDNRPSRAVALRLGMTVVGQLDDPYGVHELWAKDLDVHRADGHAPES
jgi:[ribosomal protein S5]-alanine N-acetyltransferase